MRKERDLGVLTPSEQRILQYVVAGHSNREIATITFKSTNTVKFHLKNIYSKMGARRRSHAIVLARAAS